MEGSKANVTVRRGGHGPGQKSPGMSNDFTTFFFSDFPNRFGEMDMLKIFQIWARVQKVLISRRLNRWGRRFRFMRFFDVRNVGKLERELDQIYVGNRKLNVNVPKYRRHQEVRPRVERTDARHLNMERPKFEQMKIVVTSENIRKKGKEVWVDNREKK